ncbi:hypothetical protein A8C56_03180 [Niabella ginsenosidivorans]|uniref:Uncharacterized protein n=1 Tax=Niabella ginsenosidivorans TaxID=1176587 RepID=A0A1A9HZ88_9BACT|nr:hypothetical protein A8C56_03180 [Niabella ginsenosidivorans]
MQKPVVWNKLFPLCFIALPFIIRMRGGNSIFVVKLLKNSLIYFKKTYFIKDGLCICNEGSSWYLSVHQRH